ncbi:barstar family protein [Sphingomonas sp. NBWT7]|uniref:barstar family protein n=1 Tax=Sphingomonas sp. NBWT7 TaxID=2596913 RepID=UPI00162717CC|nr:barstar family protein [Sphingomonas sp. NBWT7]QNE33156.1 barstar family protein [Sphingomonas sp. NBWT7]
MRIRLDAREWRTADDLWTALRPAIGMPTSHGPNLDALFDALVARLMLVAPPIEITLDRLAEAGPAAIAYATRVREVFDDAAAETGETFVFRLA